MLLLTLLACKGDTPTDDSVATETWTVLAEGLPGAVLSIWGESAEDLWMVGGDGGDGPMVLHLHDGAWERVDPGSTGDLWWVWGDGAGVWAVGAEGRILHYQGGSWTETQAASTDYTLFGIWGSSPTDIWAVGGNIDVATDGAILLHFDGSAWTEAALPAEAAARSAVYKVWGRSATEVYAVGTQGLVMEYDGSTWTVKPTTVSRNLFTVHGDALRTVAVGGAVGATILERNNGAWEDVSPALNQMNGVFVREGCAPVAAGSGGAVGVRGDSGWALDPRYPATSLDFHAAWVDPDCGVWAAGGHISSFPLNEGVIVYGGDAAVPAVEL